MGDVGGFWDKGWLGRGDIVRAKTGKQTNKNTTGAQPPANGRGAQATGTITTAEVARGQQDREPTTKNIPHPPGILHRETTPPPWLPLTRDGRQGAAKKEWWVQEFYISTGGSSKTRPFLKEKRTNSMPA